MVVPDSVRKQAEPKECRENLPCPAFAVRGGHAPAESAVCLSCDLEGLDLVADDFDLNWGPRALFFASSSEGLERQGRTHQAKVGGAPRQCSACAYRRSAGCWW